jgi:hypothetical protein
MGGLGQVKEFHGASLRCLIQLEVIKLHDLVQIFNPDDLPAEGGLYKPIKEFFTILLDSSHAFAKSVRRFIIPDCWRIIYEGFKRRV